MAELCIVIFYRQLVECADEMSKTSRFLRAFIALELEFFYGEVELRQAEGGSWHGAYYPLLDLINHKQNLSLT